MVLAAMVAHEAASGSRNAERMTRVDMLGIDVTCSDHGGGVKGGGAVREHSTDEIGRVY